MLDDVADREFEHLIIGTFLPNLQNLWLRRVETVTVPRLLKQIYEAETTYSARQPEGNFI